MKQEFIINPCTGISVNVNKNQKISVIDIDGGQVVDFFAHVKDNPNEFLSTGVTIDCNQSLKLSIGDTIYSNKYNSLFKIISDDVKEHDLIHPCCRPEMFDFFYKNGNNHPNCLDNINVALKSNYPIIHPVNLFMHTEILPNGKIKVLPPLSKAGDKTVLLAEENVRLGISACSVLESACNSGKCSAIKIIIEE